MQFSTYTDTEWIHLFPNKAHPGRSCIFCFTKRKWPKIEGFRQTNLVVVMEHRNPFVEVSILNLQKVVQSSDDHHHPPQKMTITSSSWGKGSLEGAKSGTRKETETEAVTLWILIS